MKAGPFRATQIWNEIVTHLKLTVEVKRRRHKMRYIDNCFTGTDAVNVVLQYLLQDRGCFGAEICREKAIKLCQTLMERSVFEPVSSRVSEGKRPVFEDSHSKMYQFIGVEPLTTDYETDEAMEDSDDDAASSSPGEERRNNQDLEPDIIGSGQDREMLCEPMLLGKQSSMMTEVLQLQKGLKRKSVNMAASHPVHNGKASRRFSFPEGTKFGDNPGEIHPAAYEEMWREVALRQLLTLVDVPMLDGLLSDDKCHRRSNRFNLVIPNVIHQQLRPLSQAAAHSDPWVKSALAVLEGLPLGLSVLDKELRAPVQAATKRELFRAIRKHYTTCQEPLLPERFIDLYLAILNLVLQERDDTAVKALQLLMILLPWHVVEEVHRLVQFMSAVTDDTHCSLEAQEENKMVAINAFTDMLIQHPMISHSLATVLVGFILTYCQQVFTVPRDIEEKVHFYIEQVKQGKLDPVIEESYCDRLTEEEYCRQAEEATAKGLKDMIDHILDDTKIPLKEKKIRLKQFQKCHPEICAKYFPDIV